MSSLDMINVLYDSDDDDDINNDLSRKTTNDKPLMGSKLPLPEAALALIKDPLNLLDDSHQHKGRIRSFKHERGNWASFVYISYDKSLYDEFRSHVSKITCLRNLFRSDVEWHPTKDMHLSLSRTIAIPHHFIDPIVETLHSKFATFNRFSINFSSSDLRFYVNDERTRSFIGFEILSWELKCILDKLVSKVDEALLDFRCDRFYEDASYHFSIAWCLGDITGNENCDKILEHFRDNWTKVEENAEYLFSFEVNEIFFKCGNKTFNFHLR